MRHEADRNAPTKKKRLAGKDTAAAAAAVSRLRRFCNSLHRSIEHAMASLAPLCRRVLLIVVHAAVDVEVLTWWLPNTREGVWEAADTIIVSNTQETGHHFIVRGVLVPAIVVELRYNCMDESFFVP